MRSQAAHACLAACSTMSRSDASIPPSRPWHYCSASGGSLSPCWSRTRTNRSSSDSKGTTTSKKAAVFGPASILGVVSSLHIVLGQIWHARMARDQHRMPGRWGRPESAGAPLGPPPPGRARNSMSFPGFHPRSAKTYVEGAELASATSVFRMAQDQHPMPR